MYIIQVQVNNIVNSSVMNIWFWEMFFLFVLLIFSARLVTGQQCRQNKENQSLKIRQNKLGLSWGSTRLRQLAWSYPNKLNIVFIIGFNIGLNMELNIWFNTGFNIGVQYWVWYWGSILGSILGFNIWFNIGVQYWIQYCVQDWVQYWV